MSEEPKIFTKTQLVEKLTEVAKKQKEKNDLIIQEKDEKIAQLTNDLTNITESLDQFKNTQEQILNNVNTLTDMNKHLSEENAKLKDQIVELESKSSDMTTACDTNMYQDFFESVKNLVKTYSNEVDIPTTAVVEETSEQKKTRKTRQKKNNEEAIVALEEQSIEVNEDTCDLNQSVVEQDSNIEVNTSDEDSIDVDALLSEL